MFSGLLLRVFSSRWWRSDLGDPQTVQGGMFRYIRWARCRPVSSSTLSPAHAW